MRNPFRRQIETAATSLRERAANLSVRLAASKPQTETATASAAQDSSAIQADPALTTIEEGRRLLAASRDAFKLPDVGINPHPDRDAAQDAVWAHFRGGVAKVIPSTARGCAALAQYAREFQSFQGVEIGEEALEILGHIARSPMLDVEAQTNALPAAILSGWAAWGATMAIDDGTNDTTAWEIADEQRSKLLHAAMALPATPESIAAKALACAWMEWVEAEQFGQPRDTYGRADQLVFDINAAIMSRGSQEEGWHASPVNLIAAAGLSVETLPVSDLCSMLEAVEIMSRVASAITCQPRQMTKGNFNGAGLLIEATAFALHRAIETVAKELRGRTPADASDQANRLASLASLTIHNDDEAETAAFARELLAMVEP